MSVFWDWRSDATQVWRRTGAADGEAPHEWLGATAADGPRHPIPGLPGTMCSEQGGVVGPWHARLPHFRLEFTPSSGEELQSEWFVARADAVAACDAWPTCATASLRSCRSPSCGRSPRTACG